MRRFALPLAILLAALPSSAQSALSQSGSQPAMPPNPAPAAKLKIVVPAETTVPLALTRPILARTAKSGDPIYAETIFPVAINNQMAIPAGTFVQGQIDTLTKPGWLSPHAHFQIHFTKIIFADGYTVQFRGAQDALPLQPAAPPSAQSAAQAVSVVTGKRAARDKDVLAAVSDAYVDVSAANDVLLDNGTQIQMVLQIPLRLNAFDVADSVRRSNPAGIPQFTSATQCRPTAGTPGTPGTSDTVIPGTPGNPGTPDVVIPGAPGMPDTVIPGIPATQGTPDTVIPGILGTPGTPGTVCPGPPIVTSNSKPQKYKETFQISSSVRIAGKQLPAGLYQVAWAGLNPSTSVDILQKGKTVFSVQASILLLNAKSPANIPETRTNSDGSFILRSLRFAGETFALYFSGGVS